MNLKPLGDRVIIKQDEAEETTASGLILTSNSKEKRNAARSSPLARANTIMASSSRFPLSRAIPLSTASTADRTSPSMARNTSSCVPMTCTQLSTKHHM